MKIKEYIDKIPWRKILLAIPIILLLFFLFKLASFPISTFNAKQITSEISSINYWGEAVCLFGLLLFIMDSFFNRTAFPVEVVSYQRIVILTALFAMLSVAYTVHHFYVLQTMSDSTLRQYLLLNYVLILTATILSTTAIMRLWPRILASALMLYLLYFAGMNHFFTTNGAKSVVDAFTDSSVHFALGTYIFLFVLFIVALDAHKDKDIGQAFNELHKLGRAKASQSKVAANRKLLTDMINELAPPPPKKAKPPPPPKKPSIELNNLDAFPDFIKNNMGGSSAQNDKIISLLEELIKK